MSDRAIKTEGNRVPGRLWSKGAHQPWACYMKAPLYKSSLTCVCVRAKLLQLCLTLCDPTDHSSLGSSVHGILQARILEWVAVSSSRGSSPPKDCRWRLYHWATREALSIFLGISFFGGDFLAIYAGVFAALHGLSLAVMSRGYSLVVLHGLLTAVASLVAEHGL